jgi:hypothetical protein
MLPKGIKLLSGVFHLVSCSESLGGYIYTFHILQIKDNSTKRFCIVPKLEYQTEYGAQCLTQSEMTRQWISLYVRPGADLYRGMLLYFAVTCNFDIISNVSLKLQSI